MFQRRPDAPELPSDHEPRSITKALARPTDPATSHDAADSVTCLTEKQVAVVRVLRHTGPLADHELIAFYHSHEAYELPQQSESGLRTRRSELVKLGVVYDNGCRTSTPGGRAAIVWSLTRRWQ